MSGNNSFRLSDILRRFRNYWSTLAVTVTLSVLAAVLNAASLVAIVALASLVSRGEQSMSRDIAGRHLDLSPGQLVVASILLIVTSMGVLLITNMMRARMASDWARSTRESLIHSFLASEWDRQSRDRVGDLQVNLGFASQGMAMLTNIVGAAQGLAGVVVLIGVAFAINPAAASGVVVLGALLFVLLRPVTFRARRANREVSTLHWYTGRDAGEISQLAQEIRIAGVTESFAHRAGKRFHELGDAERRTSVLSSMVTPIYQSMAFVAVVLALGFATTQSSIDVATLGAAALLILRSIAYGQQFQMAYTSLGTAMAPLEELEQTINALEEHREIYGNKPLLKVDHVVLDDVSFSYGADEHALHGVSTEFEFGQIYGIVGPSGAGKTTLAQLLMRLRPPDSGTLRMNGIPIRDFSATDFSRQVAHVPQAPKLVLGSVHDNIAFFREAVTREDVIAAAIAAGIHETILTLPDGYDTLIGAGERALSGGQTQRIGIARALVSHPSMIVLDEPTSALDQEAEQVIQDTLADIRGTALIVVIAHRLTTLSICDRVVVMDRGRIEAEGAMGEARAASPFLETALNKLAMATELDGLPVADSSNPPTSKES